MDINRLNSLLALIEMEDDFRKEFGVNYSNCYPGDRQFRQYWLDYRIKLEKEITEMPVIGKPIGAEMARRLTQMAACEQIIRHEMRAERKTNKPTESQSEPRIQSTEPDEWTSAYLGHRTTGPRTTKAVRRKTKKKQKPQRQPSKVQHQHDNKVVTCDEDSEVDVCAICLCALDNLEGASDSEDDDIRTNEACGHSYHEACIALWDKRNVDNQVAAAIKCPLCGV